MSFARRMRRMTRSDGAIRLATALLYLLVLLGGGATLVNLQSFRNDTLAEAHQQMTGLAAALAQHLPERFEAEEESARLAPLRAGLGENAVVAVFDRDNGLLMSLPQASGSTVPPWPALRHAQSNPWGTFDARWPEDGIERIWGYASTDDRALVVVVGLSRAQVTAPVVQLAWHMTALMAAVAAGAVLLARLLHHLQARRVVEAALRQTSRAAVVAAKAKAAFLANMSHELRTPMTGVLGMADLLMGTRLDEEQTRMLSTMRASARTLLTVLNDVLDFSKVEAGQMELERIDFDLRDVTNDAIRLLTPGAAEKGLFLSAAVDAGCPRWVKGDPARLQQVLFNLIGNAVKFTDSGGVSIRLTPEDDRITFTVEDTGIGISPEALGRLFSPFTQADASTTRRYGGTGLGLAIAKRLVGLMGGNIDAASTPGIGSTFRFTLALPPGQEPAANEAETLGLAARPLNVLLAEDNPVNQALVARMLERMGHCVTLAEHGAQALELAAARDFDAVLMDMQMPVMDGETATRLIRTLPGHRARVPVIALTADAVLEHRERYLAAGLDGFLTKPVSWKLLARTLDDAAVPHPQAAPAPASPPDSPPLPAPQEAVPDEVPPLPVIDDDYLEDMRQWVGDATLISLLETAPDSFNGEMTAIRQAWDTGDVQTIRETSHRLKGAAGSVGCRRLADLAHVIQKLTPTDVAGRQLLESLEQEVAMAAAEIIQWRPAQATTYAGERST